MVVVPLGNHWLRAPLFTSNLLALTVQPVRRLPLVIVRRTVWVYPERERCQIGPTYASWPMHSCWNTAMEGYSWPNFWANLAAFSLRSRSSCPRCRRPRRATSAPRSRRYRATSATVRATRGHSRAGGIFRSEWSFYSVLWAHRVIEDAARWSGQWTLRPYPPGAAEAAWSAVAACGAALWTAFAALRQSASASSASGLQTGPSCRCPRWSSWRVLFACSATRLAAARCCWTFSTRVFDRRESAGSHRV